VNQEDFNEFLRHPLLFPDDFKAWLQDWIAVNIPKIPISQIYGFKIHSVKSGAEVATAEALTSSSYIDLTTVGPEVENLVNGFYVVMFGGHSQSILMGLSVDGGAVDEEQIANLNEDSGGAIALLDLTTGDHQHTVTAKYKSAGGGTVSERWMHALKVVTE
jgi:hypothetical protein